MKKIINLENLILLTIFFLPAYLIKLRFFGIPCNILELLIILAIIIWLFKKNKNIGDSLKENKAIYISSGIIFIGLIISIILNPNLKTGLGIIKGWAILPIILAFIAQDVFQGDGKKMIFRTYFYSTISVAIISLVYYFSGEITFDGRLQAFFNSPNYLAMYLAPGLIWGIFDIGKNDLKHKILYCAQLIIIAAAIYLTKSFAGWVSLILAILAAYLFIYGKKNIKYLFFVILLFIAVIYSQFQTDKFNDLMNFNERSSLSSRIMIWQAAQKIISDNWLIGIGPGNFQEKYLEYQKYYPPYLEWAVPHPHSLYLSFWLSGGLLGILGFLSLIFFWMRNYWQAADKIKYIGIFAILLYIPIHGLFDTTYFKNDLAVVFWLVILAGTKKENIEFEN